MSIASALGLPADDAVTLHDSNKLALRLLPCDVFARVAHVGQEVAHFEIALAQRLAETGSPVAALEPRVEPRGYERDGFEVTLWTYYEPVTPQVPAADYANALERLHAGMRTIDVPTPHFTERVADAPRSVASTPLLDDAERELLSSTLRDLGRAVTDRGAPEQLLHGEPHPGNVLRTRDGLLFVDLETCCRGPVEFDIAHATLDPTGPPIAVAAHYAGADPSLVRDCWMLTLALATAWRWDRGDQFPDGRRLGTEWLSQLRADLGDRGSAVGVEGLDRL